MGAHPRVLGESYLMNTNMTWFKRFSMFLRVCVLDESSLSIGQVKVEFVRQLYSVNSIYEPLPKNVLELGNNLFCMCI